MIVLSARWAGCGRDHFMVMVSLPPAPCPSSRPWWGWSSWRIGDDDVARGSLLAVVLVGVRDTVAAGECRPP